MAKAKAKKKTKHDKIHLMLGTEQQYSRDFRQPGAKVMCGAKLFYTVKQKLFHGGTSTTQRRLETRRLDPAAGAEDVDLMFVRGFCPSCKTLARLTPDERIEWHANKQRQFDKLKAAGDDKRKLELAERDAQIARARQDAHACLDAYEAGVALRRCNAWLPGDRARCNLPWDQGSGCTGAGHKAVAGHDSKCEPAVDLGETLGLAVLAWKRNNKSDAGQRTWLFKPIDAMSPMPDRREQSTERNIVCRFCQRVLGQGFIGMDYSNQSFYLPLWAGNDILEAVPTFPGLVSQADGGYKLDVYRHTTICALRYLIGLERSIDAGVMDVADDDDDNRNEVSP